MTTILGISAYYHDAAAAIVRDGVIVAAAQEERFTRRKHDPSFPRHAIEYCLQEAGLSIDELDHVVFYDKPLRKLDRILETFMDVAPRGLKAFTEAMRTWMGSKMWLGRTLRAELGWAGRMAFCEHHESHAASAFFPSPFEEAAVITFDGVGEWATTTWGMGRGNHVEIKEQIRYPDSIGMLYSAFTYYTGFRVNSGEYKLMGLAPYGEPRFADTIRKHILSIKPDGSVALNLDCFGYRDGLTMTTPKFDAVFGGPARAPETPISQREMDIAASIQVVIEEIVIGIAERVYEQTQSDNLCLAGGVALNCVANGRLLREGPFKNIWIQPAAGDAGGALGAALAIWHHRLDNPRKVGEGDSQSGSYLGPTYSDDDVRDYFDNRGIPHQYLSESELYDHVADRLEDGEVLGWFQGRMEFGPRALGGRTIIGDPRSAEMQKKMNLRIKYRESFRPFAPSVLREHASEWFQLDVESPYMLLVAPVAEHRRISLTAEQKALFGIERLNVPRSSIPAVTHVDYSARVQTVDGEHNPRYYGLLKRFHESTGCPVLVNTSFNVRGEPIVCTPADAYRCFMGTEMDALVIGRCLLDKKAQPNFEDRDYWRRDFPSD